MRVYGLMRAVDGTDWGMELGFPYVPETVTQRDKWVPRTQEVWVGDVVAGLDGLPVAA